MRRNLKSILLRAVTIALLGVVSTGFVRTLGQSADGAASSRAVRTAYEAALDAYKAGQFDAAHAGFTALAQRGNADARAMLGVVYFHGAGVAADPAKAAIWFYLAAEAGQANAQLILAQMYLAGQGVAASTQDAAFWLTLADERALAGMRPQIAALRADIDKAGLPGGWGPVERRAALWRPQYPLAETLG